MMQATRYNAPSAVQSKLLLCTPLVNTQAREFSEGLHAYLTEEKVWWSSSSIEPRRLLGCMAKNRRLREGNDLYVAAWDRTWKLAKGWDFASSADRRLA